MKTLAVRLAAENGKQIGKGLKAKRIAAEPATEAARLRRCLAHIHAEAEKARAAAVQAEAVLEKCLAAVSQGDPILSRAMVREALIECPNTHRFALLVRYCEMAEEGTLSFA